MSRPGASVAGPDALLAVLDDEKGPDRQSAARILELVVALAAAPAPFIARVEDDPRGSMTAFRIATTAARTLAAHPESLVVVEVAAAVQSAPWITDDASRLEAMVDGLRVAGRLLPGGALDVGRDTGSWGAIAGAVGVGRRARPDLMRQIALIAGSLSLAPVAAGEVDDAYLAVRAGHAAASALLAVTLAEAGFVGDVQAIDELQDRLRVSDQVGEGRNVAELAAHALERMEAAIR